MATVTIHSNFGATQNKKSFTVSIVSQSMASLVAQRVKRLPARWETLVQSLGWEDPLEEGMATHSSILPWKIPTDRGASQATVHGVTKSQTGLKRLSSSSSREHYLS